MKKAPLYFRAFDFVRRFFASDLLKKLYRDERDSHLQQRLEVPLGKENQFFPFDLQRKANSYYWLQSLDVWRGKCEKGQFG
jgi:hypothetical protein